MGLFFMVRSGTKVPPLVPVKGNLNAPAYNDILDNSVFSTFLPTVWGRPFPVSA